MAKRHAILIGNAVSYGVASKNIPTPVVRALIQDFAGKLDNLGDHAFDVTTVINKTTEEASKIVLSAIKQARGTELLFIYYFGHAVRPVDSDHDLFLYFRGSDWLELPSMLDFGDIAKWLKSFKPKQVVVALDCCYAGAVRDKLRLLDGYGGKFFVLASVSHRGKAQVDYSLDQPVGVFSKNLLSAFSDPQARSPLSRDVTFESAHNYASARTTHESRQEPVSFDGGSAKEVFFRQTLTPMIAPAIRSSVPRKSTYRKLFVLGEHLVASEFETINALYSSLAKADPIEFKTPYKTGRNTLEYRFMGPLAFSTYVELCRDLGVIEQRPPIRLTSIGKAMMRRDGQEYNKELYACLTRAWKLIGIELPDLEQAIGNRVRANGIPTVQGLFLEMYVSMKLRVSREYFRVLLDLTAYTGALRSARDHTFFLPGAIGAQDAA